MNCSKAQRLINDYIDNLLEPELAQRLESHLEKCADCKDLFLDLKSIVDNAVDPYSPTPTDDLWPVIKRQVLKKNREPLMNKNGLFRHFPMFSRGPAFALSALLVILLMAPVFYFGVRHFRNAPDGYEKNVSNNFQIAEQQYQSAITALNLAIVGRYEKINPELMAVFEKNLAIIDESIRICKESMDNSIYNRETNRLLLVCYRKKIELLNELKDIAIQS